MSKYYIVILILLSSFVTIRAQEICTNGLDDDNDGFIDLNDAECSCGAFVWDVASLLLNPSFEEYLCIPTNYAQFECLEDWLAGGPWADQIDAISTEQGWYPDGIEGPFPDLPLPDGNSIIGIANNFSVDPYKEYLAQCFPLMGDSLYTLTVEVDFPGSSITFINAGMPLTLCVYGYPVCTESSYTCFFENEISCCPIEAEEGGFIEMGCMEVSGFHEWKTCTIQFQAPLGINKILIGPDCVSVAPFGSDPVINYYYLDNFIFKPELPVSLLRYFHRFTFCFLSLRWHRHPAHKQSGWSSATVV